MYWTALAMGLAGGLHCAGMCGPLVLAFTSKNPFLGGKVVYNLGRVLTYSILGMLAGFLGSYIQFFAFQNLFAYVTGGILLLLGFGAINGIRIPIITAIIQRFTNYIKMVFGVFLHSRKNIFFLGMVNGLLPCGLTYMAWTYCLTMEGAAEGFLFMAVFGLGTIPVMTGFMWVLGKILARFKISYRRVSMLVLILLGSLVIARTFLTHQHGAANYTEPLVSGEVICR